MRSFITFVPKLNNQNTKMKKLTLLSIASLMSMASFAEGYQVNMQSTKQSGMGHVGVAMKLGAESMHFNPAGMVFMKETVDLSAGISGIWTKAHYKNEGYKASTDNDVATPLYAYAGFKVYDNLAIGLSLNTPYGSGIKWPNRWKGADLVQEISMKAFSFQPTVSWKITDNFSIGAGLMLATGNFNLSRALITGYDAVDLINGMNLSPEILDKYPELGKIVAAIKENPDLNYVSAHLHGKSSVKVGYNVGAMWDINDKWTLGASFRSRMNMHAKRGTAKMDYLNKQIESLVALMAAQGKFPPIDKGTFDAELPLPWNLTIGTSFKPIDRLIISADLQMVGWGAYDKLVLQFDEKVLNNYSIEAKKDYKNTFIGRLGAQYALTERLDVRAGVYFDQSPVRAHNYNPETPGMNKIGTSIGASFRPVKGFSIDFSMLYIAGLSRDGSYTYNTVFGTKRTFSGRYSCSAFAPSLGGSYTF